MQKEGWKSLTSLRGEKPYKRIGWKRQKIWFEPWPIIERERESVCVCVCLKTFWKVSWTRENQVFKKLYTIFDRLKIRFDRSKMLRLIQYQSSIDRNNRGWLKILIAISIDIKTGSIDRNFGKKKILKNKAILCRNSSKHWILWIKCMSMRWNVFHKHKFWT